MKRTATIVAEDGSKTVNLRLSVNVKKTESMFDGSIREAADERIAAFVDDLFERFFLKHFHARSITIK